MFTETLRRAAPYGWVAVALAVLYLAGVFALRHAGPLTLPSSRTESPGVPPGYYGGQPRIESFYTGSPVITRGEHATVCYGTRSVSSVRLDPPEEALSPALNRCFAVAPLKTTTYTMHATGSDGRALSASFTIAVDPPKPEFRMISVSAKEVVRGDRWAICYTTEHASSVRLEPNNISLPAGAKRCYMLFPMQSIEYRLVAFGEAGITMIKKIPVTVLPRPKAGAPRP